MNKILGFLAVTSLFLLSACGQQVCVMGIGKCDIPVAAGQTGATGGNLSYTLNPPTQSILVKQPSIITVQGGTPPYSIEKTDGEGAIAATSSFGSTNRWTYTPPETAVATGMVAKIKITDNGNPEKKQILLEFTVRPR